MAKTVRGTLFGVIVQTSEENAARLGDRFKPEKKATAEKASPKSDK